MTATRPAGVVSTSADGLGVGLYSHDDLYRYWFLTEVDPVMRPGVDAAAHHDGFPVLTRRTLVWIGLNPSQSDNNGKPRPTLGSVLFWARRAGLSRVLGVNLYAYRHTDPKVLASRLRSDDLESVIGEGNDHLLRYVAARAEHVLLAWSSKGSIGGRGANVADLFPTGQCIGLCRNGEPLHPARKRRSLQFQPYRS